MESTDIHLLLDEYEKKKVTCCVRFARLCAFIRFCLYALLFIFLGLIIYYIYVYISSFVSAVGGVANCVASPRTCFFGNTSVDKEFALVSDPDPTLTQFVEQYTKCKSIRHTLKVNSSHSIFSESFILQSCLCDVTPLAYQSIQNCTFSGDWFAIAKHCVGLDVPDCKNHIRLAPRYASLPRAPAIVVKTCDWTCWFEKVLPKFLGFSTLVRSI